MHHDKRILRHGQRHIDRSLSRTNREDFNLYVRDKVSWVWEIELEKQPSLKPNQIQVAHENSHSDPCIQLVDYIAGATFQKYERNRPKYYALIESRVESFTYLW
jgi:regulator of sigma D